MDIEPNAIIGPICQVKLRKSDARRNLDIKAMSDLRNDSLIDVPVCWNEVAAAHSVYSLGFTALP